MENANNKLNLKDMTLAVLKTVVLLNRSYGADYLARILQGFDRFGLRDDSHRELETFGELDKMYSTRITRLIYHLVAEKYLWVKNKVYGSLAITDKGTAFLDTPQDLWVSPKVLETPELERLLYTELRKLRTQLSENAEIMPYEVFNNYSLAQLVSQKPRDLKALKAIHGVGDATIERYGQAILACISHTVEHAQQLMVEKRAKTPSLQAVKDLFLAGKPVEEIAEVRSIKSGTVMSYLDNLHRAGEVNLMPWIEETVDPQQLHKATSYFQQAEDKRLKAAYEVLGLDYDTLRLCRLYVAGLSSQQDEMAMAS
jgi:hypothetical protein